MANTFKIMLRDPVSGRTAEWRSADHKRAVAQARLEHGRGGHVTVVNEHTGNVVLWLGENLAPPADQPQI